MRNGLVSHKDKKCTIRTNSEAYVSVGDVKTETHYTLRYIRRYVIRDAIWSRCRTLPESAWVCSSRRALQSTKQAGLLQDTHSRTSGLQVLSRRSEISSRLLCLERKHRREGWWRTSALNYDPALTAPPTRCWPEMMRANCRKREDKHAQVRQDPRRTGGGECHEYLTWDNCTVIDLVGWRRKSRKDIVMIPSLKTQVCVCVCCWLHCLCSF